VPTEREILYVYPRIPRAGLGNCLFPWARAIVRSELSQATLLDPIWGRVRVGPILRGERDPRRYGRLFRSVGFGARANELSVIAGGEVVDETGKTRWRGPRQHTTLLVEGPAHHFHDLMPHRALITERFLTSLRPGTARPDTRSQPYIAAHVRLGDFARVADPTSKNRSTEVGWYVRQIMTQRSRLGQLPVVVCSDGSDDELSGLLSLEGVRRSSAITATGDLLTLAGAQCLLGSSSTFTAWGHFLGHGTLVVGAGNNHYLPAGRDVTEEQ
jgi:hypothetical protein